MRILLLRSFAILCSLLICLNGKAQSQGRIWGRVTDEQGEPLVGVSVVIKGTSTGSTTGTTGYYNLSLGNRDKAIITFSYVGMKSRDIPVTGTTKELNVRLQSDTNIDAVVIQGYGRVQKREDLVGSAYQVNTKDLEFKPLARIDNILDGMVPGMSVQPNADYPSTVRTRNNIRIRGEASLSASNEPLWIVDGVPIYTGDRNNQVTGFYSSVSPLSFINPSDVESITVLKDASEVSIYGADGSNGVILVTTKSGKLNSGPTKVQATLRYGISAIDESTRFKTLNGAQYMAYAKEAWVNGGNDPRLFPYQDNDRNSYSTTDTNWSDLYYGIGQDFQANISITGGNQYSANYFSISYYRNNATVKGNTQQRVSAMLNNTYKLGKRLTIRPKLAVSYNVNDIFNLTHEYYETLPIFSPFENDGYTYRLYNKYVDGLTDTGEPIWKERSFTNNEIPTRDLNSDVQQTLNTDANLILSYEILKGLTATGQFGASFQYGWEKLYASRHTLDGMVEKVPQGHSERRAVSNLAWTNIWRLNFDRTFCGKHHVSALAGVELSSKGYNTLQASGRGFLNDHVQEIAYAEESTRKGSSSTRTTRKLSFLAQVGYTYDSRYSIQASMRRDGNSAFGKFSRYENYFSVGGAWNIHNEKFFTSKTVDMLKLKASFGTTGNSRVDGAQMRGLGIFSYGDAYSYNGIIGGIVSTPANPGITWEKTYKTNLGLDISLWERLSLGVEVYFEKTKDMLSSIRTSNVITDGSIYSNIGEMSNRGIELTLNSTNIDHQNFKWTTNFLLSHNRNRIDKLYNGDPITAFSSIKAEGYDVNSYYLVRWAGVDPSTGDPMWYDKEGNLTHTYTDANRVIVGSSSPKVMGSMTNTFRLYNFTLSFMLNYTIGGHAYSSIAARGTGDGYGITDPSGNVSVNSLEYWRQPGDVVANPRISTVSSNSSSYSTRFLYNKTHIRLQNLVLTYNLPKRIARKIAMSSCRISFIADNLYLWTPDQKRGRNSYKTVMNGYPVQRTFSLNLDLTF